MHTETLLACLLSVLLQVCITVLLMFLCFSVFELVCRLDYNNFLLASLPKSTTSPLQRAQNAPARLVAHLVKMLLSQDQPSMVDFHISCSSLIDLSPFVSEIFACDRWTDCYYSCPHDWTLQLVTSVILSVCHTGLDAVLECMFNCLYRC